MAQRAAGSEEAVYRRIAAEIRREIESGQLRPGDRVPGENALMERYGVAKQTARDALAVLRVAGVIETRPGSGTFVRALTEIPRWAGRRLKNDRWASGLGIQSDDTGVREHGVDGITVTEEIADERVAALLEIPTDSPILVRRRRYMVEGRPVQYAVSRLPFDLVRDSMITAVDTGPGGIYARLADLGMPPTRFVEELRAHTPTTDDMRVLELPAATPVVTITRVALTADDRAVEVNDMTFDASAYRFMYDLDA